eukprot:TRINITY_DN3425_c0_g1_i12.p1 TRINITY_DN3425_c0_g1~~TRINITY_DN3425_c0_g1_i12.p1  ORF type:complete len:223 (+),score=-29.31 TRINITY_DN3425_c0_g1_i12:310-978(+)
MHIILVRQIDKCPSKDILQQKCPSKDMDAFMLESTIFIKTYSKIQLKRITLHPQHIWSLQYLYCKCILLFQKISKTDNIQKHIQQINQQYQESIIIHKLLKFTTKLDPQIIKIHDQTRLINVTKNPLSIICGKQWIFHRSFKLTMKLKLIDKNRECKSDQPQSCKEYIIHKSLKYTTKLYQHERDISVLCLRSYIVYTFLYYAYVAIHKSLKFMIKLNQIDN